MTTRTITIADVLRAPSDDLLRALSGLSGCPVGGWPETRQAMARIGDCLPRQQDRDFTVAELIAATHAEDSAGRYRRR